jgi:HEAT repeat protein
MPSVFISYSHDQADPTHAERVAGLAASLLDDSLEVFFDQNRDDVEEKVPWPIWMEGKLRKADYVLLVCTELYLKKVHQEVAEDEGRGVCWEANLIYNRLYIAKLNTTKYVPILFSRSDEKFIPGPLEGAPYRFVLDSSEAYSQLYAFLFGLHRPIFPRQGNAPLPIEQKVIPRLFPPPGKVSAVTPTLAASAPDKPIEAVIPRLMLKPDTPPVSRQDIRGLDWYHECDAGHFLGRSKDANEILGMLLDYPIIRLAGSSGVGKSSLIRAGLLPKIRGLDWRACVIRPFEDPAGRIPRQLTTELLTGPGSFTTPLDSGKFRAEVSPLLSSNGVKRLVLFLDQFEDIVSPGVARAAVDAMREFLQELWEQKETKPSLRAVVVYRTDADTRLGRLWQEISDRPEGLPYFALQGLSPGVGEDIINQTAREQGWRLEVSVPEIVRQLAVESQKLGCSDEVFPVYLQMFLKQAQQNPESCITAQFIAGFGSISGLIGKYLEQTLTRLKARGGDWQQCGAVLESLSRSTGVKAAQSFNDLVRETGVNRSILAEMLPVLINERLVRPIGHESYEIQHDRLAAAVIESMKESDREAKAAREFLAAKVPVFESTMVSLTPGELVYLYRHRQKIHPTEREVQVLLASMLHNIEAGARNESPGAYWLAKSSPQDFLYRLIQIERWAAEGRGGFCPSHEWVKAFPLSGLECQFAALAGDQTTSVRTMCAYWIDRTKRNDDLPLLRKLAKDQDPNVHAAAAAALASFAHAEDLPLLREVAKDQDPDVRKAAVKALANFAQAEDLPLLRELAKDRDPGVHTAAIKALASFSRPEALPLLRELADDGNWNVRMAAIKALASFSRSEALRLLRQLAGDQDWRMRTVTVEALASFAQAEDTPLLRELAKDRNWDVRMAAIKALASFSRPEDLPLLRQLAEHDPNSAVRMAAIKPLASFSRPEDLPLLRQLARDRDPGVHTAAIKALASFSRPEDLPLLRELVREWDPGVHTAAIEALASSSSAVALSLLRELAKDQDRFVRARAVEALASFSKEEDLPLLRQLAGDEDLFVRARAVEALASFPQAEDLPLLRQLAKDHDWLVRAGTVKALASSSSVVALSLLRELAEDQNLDVRARAVEALASFARPEALLVLRALALAPYDNVAVEAVRSLTLLCSREELTALLNQHDQELCAGALAALDKVLYMPEWLKTNEKEQNS